MEFCELGDLSYFIKKRETLSGHVTTADMVRKYPNPAAGGLHEVIVRHFLKQLASALEFLREKDYIHRDVKPQNLLLDPSPQYYRTVKPEHIPYAAYDRSLTPIVGVESLPTLKIADFGFARSLPATSLAETLCGSPLYMAPEILRYEKYDARADLWSVGTVLYEMMVGRPPFRASNHVELLRRIERGEDRIRFPEEVCISDSMKKLIRGLLKRNPEERTGFEDFFNHTVVMDEIPGLVEEDRIAQMSSAKVSRPKTQTSKSEGKKAESVAGGGNPKSNDGSVIPDSPRRRLSESPKTTALRAEGNTQRRSAGTPPRTATGDLRDKRQSLDKAKEYARENTEATRRPSITSHATAPARHDLHGQTREPGMAADMNRRTSRASPLSNSPATQERLLQRERVREAREAQERVAQEIAFERDYVLIDKRNVEVNAFADELAACPKISGPSVDQQHPTRGAIVRRATTQGHPASTTGTHPISSKAIQAAASKRPEQGHYRQNSHERRLRDTPSATSAISKAINMASGRLFNLGFSPPIGIGKTGQSPPTYSPFPSLPATTGSLLMLQEGSKAPVPLDEDLKTVQAIEESATRSNVVFGFAEIKFQQLIPAAPSMDGGLGIHQEADDGESKTSEGVDLNIGATIACAEEALVLYIKALALLARATNIAGAWWARKKRTDLVDHSSSPGISQKSASAVSMTTRVNNVVQWVRGRFNETLEKAEYVQLKALEAHRQLPSDHPGHPNNRSGAQNSGSSEVPRGILITTGVSAEKLMYDLALDKSRAAAVNELVGDNLPGCAIDYITAIWLLEAILEDDDSEVKPQKEKATARKDSKTTGQNEGRVNGVDTNDQEAIRSSE